MPACSVRPCMFLGLSTGVFCRAVPRNVPVTSVRYATAAAAKQKPHAKRAASRTTALYDLHVSLGAKMVEFTGWQMPLTYGDQSISESHLHTRKHCSIFDVSHMQQMVIHGNDRLEFWESVCVSDVRDQLENSGALSLLTNESGGIIDDTVWMNGSRGQLFVVVNAGCAQKDVDYLSRKVIDFQRKGKAAHIGVIGADERSLLAVQGPEMARVLQFGLRDSLDRLPFMHTVWTSLFGFEGCRITRCGYTGEDGVEISCLTRDVVELCEKLLASRDGKVLMAGLGARDSLRLEAGLCLYGNDIDEQTTPVEAGLTWAIGKRRRQEGGFPGDKVILRQIKDGADRKRVGLISSGPPARKGYAVLDSDGKEIGVITSGCPSPSTGKNIAMAYVPPSLSKPGTKVGIVIRNQTSSGEIVKMPFVKSNYFHARGHKQQ